VVMVTKGSPMDLSTLVTEMKPRLREMIGANIALQLNLEREGPWVKADARLTVESDKLRGIEICVYFGLALTML